jgi:hypothetical protein
VLVAAALIAALATSAAPACAAGSQICATT